MAEGLHTVSEPPEASISYSLEVGAVLSLPFCLEVHRSTAGTVGLGGDSHCPFHTRQSFAVAKVVKSLKWRHATLTQRTDPHEWERSRIRSCCDCHSGQLEYRADQGHLG